MCEWSECEVTNWEGWQKGGMEFKDKIVLYCSKEAICMQGFTAGI